ncbi:pectinesterase/pectinesterase inhibitor 28-like [Dorcoceras hygrometricum]|uniref:Pectinesterase n=1 Tax=Dorcoceras hygrometricum TaxID=472368 RepID=A0A2Z7BH29_9LAMI|nr:pectinesterase/pectinesterase inhibitor 28-like [Dorcoceras hygrometricum]
MGFDSGSKKKKVAVAGLASILLVAAVVAVTVGVSNKGGDSSAAPASNGGAPTISASTKAVQAICSPTDYKETCEQSLAGANTTDPKELIKLAFNYAVENIGEVIKNSTLLKDAAADERTKGALDTCQELLHTSVDDLKRSFEKFGEFDVSNLNEYVEDVKTWLSASITYQETCIDGFENSTGDTAEKMKKLLKTAAQLSSNGLAMVTDFSSVLAGLNLESLGSSRRLLSQDSIPSFVNPEARKLLAATPISLKPNAVVAQDGSTPYKTIKAAIDAIPKKNNKTFVIFVKAGLYKETVIIPKKVNNVVLIGEGPTKTRITGNKNFADGTQTFHTATLAVNGEGFIAKDIAIENTAGPEKHQAVAVRVSGDKAIFYNVHMNGYQDTLYAHAYRQYYRDCVISGTIDFVFGDALSIFQKTRLVVRKPMNNQACMVTAQGRKDRRGVGAIILQGCDIVAEPAFTAAKPALEAYLGRPWKEFSRTIIMQSNIDGFISPEGWSPWAGTYALDTLYYGEYQNRGAGANLSHRVKWKGIKKITPQIAASFTGGKVYTDDSWVKVSGVPYVPTLM